MGKGVGCGGVHGYESWSGRMDGRTQTLKSARAIDAINGCVRLVAGKIDDEQGGTLPSRESEHGCTAGEDGAKTEISIFRPLRGGSMLISAPCPVSARSAFQNTNDACETHSVVPQILRIIVYN